MRKGVLAVLLLPVWPAAAAERGQVGLNATVSASPSVGLTYQLSRRVALRPSLHFSKGDTTFFLLEPIDGVFGPIRGNFSSVGGSLEFQYHLSSQGDLSPYLGLGLGYDRYTVDYHGRLADRRESATNVSALLGLQYALNEHLAVFTQAGISYAWEGSDDRLRTFRSEIGLVFYFK